MALLKSLRFRLLLNFLVMIAVVVAVTLYTVRSATYSHSSEQLLEHAVTSASMVEDKIINRGDALLLELSTLSKDFTFKGLISTGNEDKESLLAALQNFQNRGDADIAWILDSSGAAIVSSPEMPLEKLAIEPKLYQSDDIRWFKIDDQFYLLKSAPVKFVESSRKINAWLLMGIAAEKLISQELVELTNMHVSLLILGEQNQVVASTHEASLSDSLVEQSIDISPGLHSFERQLSDWIYASNILGSWDSSAMRVVLDTEKDKAYLSYNSLLLQLIGVLLVAALMALVAAMLLSNGITRPITKLVNAAAKIREGEYVEHFPKASTDEVTSLSTAISSMQEGIKRREEEIQHLAYYDTLTGLPNRNQFQKNLVESINQSGDHALAILMMDVDRFKEINDTIGHAAGDELLQEIAQRLNSAAYKGVSIAHLGGDEFAVIIENVDEQRQESILENFSSLFERPFEIEKLALEVDVSIGLAMYPRDAKTAQGLMQCADIALYSCKGKHFGYAVYQESLNKHSVQRLSLMSELRSALAEGQLQLFYQPKLSIAERKITTVECLIRWIHPEHGFIPPDDFIPLAEQTGAIRDVTHWGLRTAFEQCSKWREMGHNIGVAVNISAMDLVDMQLPTYVAELMSEFDTDNTVLTLEVTESAVMSDPQSALKALNTLRRMGIALSIDDFGTGYSSMAQLKKMPVDELKIDKAFVLDLANNDDDKIMVRTLMSLAQNLGLNTVAEGVEDKETLKFLEQIGCTKAQGFYLSRPLPADKFNEWLESYDPNTCMD